MEMRIVGLNAIEPKATNQLASFLLQSLWMNRDITEVKENYGWLN